MKVAQINVTCGQGSTGKIAVSISRLLSQKNIENRIFYSEGTSDHALSVKYMNFCELKIGALESRVSGYYGFESYFATKRLLSHIESFDPDIVHLHNLHGHNCNLELMFTYLKKSKKKIFWTFHDCWAFTGYCPHFTFAECGKWTSGCFACPLRSEFSFFKDRSRELWEKKKDLFGGLDLTIVTPSMWLAGLARRSFLKDYPVEVINNGIDLEVFKPAEGDFRAKYHLENKYVLLGVAFNWGVRKGLDVFIKLSEQLDGRFRIVLVGTDAKVDRQLPSNIVSIHRTHDQKELAEIYSAADVFVNLTREDNFPTTNIEALACGTPVITTSGTGGGCEMLDEKCGVAVDINDTDEIMRQIVRICTQKVFSAEDCVERAKMFDQNRKFREYVELYENKINAE